MYILSSHKYNFTLEVAFLYRTINNGLILYIAAGSIAVLIGGLSWLFINYINLTGVNDISNIIMSPFSSIISFLAPPNPHLMSDRQLSYVVIKIIYELFGTSDVGWKASFLLFHILNCIIVYCICSALQKNTCYSILVSFLFLSAPVSVFSIADNDIEEILCLFFILMCIYMHIKSIKMRSRLSRLVSLFAFYLALRTKEYSLLVPGIIIFVRLSCFNFWALPLRKSGPLFFLKIIAPVFPFILVELFYLFFTNRGLEYSLSNFILFVPKDNLYVQDFSIIGTIDRFIWYCGYISGLVRYNVNSNYIINAHNVNYYALTLVFIIPLVVSSYNNINLSKFGMQSFILMLLPTIPLPHIASYYCYVSSPFYYMAVGGVLYSLVSKYISRCVGLVCIAIGVSYMIYLIFIAPQFDNMRRVELYSSWSDKLFVDFMANNFKSLPKGTVIYIDGIDAPINSSHVFPIGTSIYPGALRLIYQDSTLDVATGQNHNDILKSYMHAIGPKAMVRLYSAVESKDWPRCIWGMPPIMDQCLDTAKRTSMWRAINAPPGELGVAK